MEVENGKTVAVDLLVKGCDIVSMNGQNEVISDGAVVVDKGRIVWLGKAGDLDPELRPRETLRGDGRIAMPGLVDAHVHTVQHFLRGKIAQMSRTRAIKNPPFIHYYVPYEGMLDPDEVHLCGLLAFTNMIRNGTTCFADAGAPHADQLGRAAVEVGIRGFISLSTMDESEFMGAKVPESMKATPQEAYDRNIALVNRWRDNDRVKAWLALRQLIVCSPDLIKGLTTAARDLDVKLHTHLSAGAYEIDHSAAVFGKRPVDYLASIGALSRHLHGAHTVLFSAQELDLYVTHKASACTCAFHNYAMGTPRLFEMWRRGVDVGLGTDGVTPFGSLDLFQVAHAARIGEQAISGAPWHVRTPVSGEELLKIATRGGARALGIDHEIGSLEIGKKADFILCDKTDLDQLPVHDPLFTASHGIVGRDVRSVVVDGSVVMKEGEILTVDMAWLRSELASRQSKVMDRFEKIVG